VTALVGVGIPSYNHARHLPAAIESVLGQTLRDVEVVIGDDGSTDDSLEIAERYAAAHPERVRVVTHPSGAHLGIAPTGNLCRSQLHARYVLGLPSDDVLYPDALEREVELMERRRDLGFVYGYAHRIDAAGRRIPGAWTFGRNVTRGGGTVERLVQGNKIPAMTVMFRRECLERVGPEDETLVYSDWEFFTRAASHWKVGFLPRALAMHRIHGTNTSFAVPRETNVARSIEVTAALAERARHVGGRLAEPRVLAILELQMAFLRFVSEDRPAAEVAVGRAFARDPSLAGDGDWLGDWIWDRVLDALLPDTGPYVAPWLEERLRPFLGRQASATLGRRAASARAAERAVRLARCGLPARASAAALAAVARTPGRLLDRQLAAVLLETAAGGAWARSLLRARSRLRPSR
jgi:GT2 family glycosyltransferase